MVLTDDEVGRLLNACGQGTAGLRNRALTAVPYRTGPRIDEALELFPKDLDVQARSSSTRRRESRWQRAAPSAAQGAPNQVKHLETRGCA